MPILYLYNSVNCVTNVWLYYCTYITPLIVSSLLLKCIEKNEKNCIDYFLKFYNIF